MKKRLFLFAFVLTLLLQSVSVFANSFSDIPDSPYKEHITKFAQNGYISGYNDGTFKPNNKITRAEVITIISKLNLTPIAGDTKFVDIKTSDWYYEFVLNGARSGVISGYPDKTFKPSENITRYEAINIISKFVRDEKAVSVTIPYADANTIPSWVNQSVKTLYSAKIIDKYPSNQLSGNEKISREEIVSMFAKVMDKSNWNNKTVANNTLDNLTNPLAYDTSIPQDLLGYLSIPSIKIKDFPVKDGSDLTTLKTAIGHFAETSIWNGNVSVAGHNRDYKYDFRDLKNVNIGDTLNYKTRFGERTYKIVVKEIIEETDWKYVNEKSEVNKFTMITCVADQPTKRLCVQAVEVIN